VSRSGRRIHGRGVGCQADGRNDTVQYSAFRFDFAEIDRINPAAAQFLADPIPVASIRAVAPSAW
jgi:hypothetical protein